MPIFVIKHLTTYRYRKPVAFGEHRMMLRPRDDGDQVVLGTEIDILPAPSRLSWTQDRLGNHVATAEFAKRSSELRFQSTIRLDHAPMNFAAHDIADHARVFSFVRDAGHPPVIAPRRGASARAKLGRRVSRRQWHREYLRSSCWHEPDYQDAV